MALEVPADASAGLQLECLRTAIDRHEVRAVVAVTNVSNRLDATMSDERKRELVELLAASRIALVEDDVWGDLSFGLVRQRAAKAYDRRDRVLRCGSFSKTLAPGLLARLAYETVREMMRNAMVEPDARPGMVAVIQTFGSSLKWVGIFVA